MDKRFSRSEMLLGSEGLSKLSEPNIAIFGVGGVGSFTAETLVRTGIASITLIDYDIIDISNINRQVHASTSTLGLKKVSVMKERLLDINPKLKIKIHDEKYLPETKDLFDFNEYDYVVDAIDTISGKLSLIETCKEKGIPIISAMGAGNKLDPTKLKVSDIYETRECSLARVMRRELRKRNIKDLQVVWSDEEAKGTSMEKENIRKSTPASIMPVPAVMGIIIASKVMEDIL